MRMKITKTMKKMKTKASVSLQMILRDYLVSFTWGIYNFTVNGVNNTSFYNDFRLIFNSKEKSVLAERDNKEVEGSWAVVIEDNNMKFELDFKNSEPFSLLNGQWILQECDENMIHLKRESINKGSISIFKFERLTHESGICA